MPCVWPVFTRTAWRLLRLRIPDKVGFLFLRRCSVSYLMHLKANPESGVKETQLDLLTVN